MEASDADAKRGHKPEISRFMFAMFDVLGFSKWVENTDLQVILDAYHTLIQKAVIERHQRGGLTTVLTPDGHVMALTPPPSFTYFSDTILLWCPLEPVFADLFIGSCKELMCEALAMNIPLRGAIALGEAVLDLDANYFIGKPIVEAANLEKGQNWIGLTLGDSAVWSPFLAQIHPTSLIEYEVPMKTEFKEFASPIVVDWPRRWRELHGECPTAKLQGLNCDPKHSLYWDNTIEFAANSLKRHDWHLRPEQIPEGAMLRMVKMEDAAL